MSAQGGTNGRAWGRGNVGGGGRGRGAAPGRARIFLTVVHAGLRSNFGLAVLKHRLFKEKKDRWLVPIIAVAGLSVVPMFYGIVLLIQNIYGVLKPVGQERALLSLGFLAGQLLILIFGIYYVIAAFYFSRDLEFLIPLPLRPAEVMASKFAVIVINEYLTVVAVVLPIVVTFGVLARGGPGYWVNAALVYAALPIIPLAFVSVLVVAMMRFINVSRKKDALILIGSILLIVLALGLQVVLGRTAGNGAEGMEASAQAIAAFFTSPDSLLNRVGAFFPPGIWATRAVAGGFTGEGLAHLALLWGVSILLLAVMVGLAEKLFYRGVVGLGETTGRKRRLSRDEMARRVTSGRRAKAAVFWREWKIMNRTPIFLLNGTLVPVLFPAIFAVMAMVDTGGGGAGGGGVGSGEGGPMALLKAMESANPLVVILAMALFMTFCGSLNGTASSTFSREGRQFWISRVIPVAPREQAAAKFLHSYLVAVLGVITAGGVGAFFLHIAVARLAVAACLALVAGVLLTAVGMIIDLARPLLDWANPQKAIKQNLNVLLAILADIGILTGVFFAVKALVGAKLGTEAVLGIVFAGLAALSAASCVVLLKFADKRYPAIE
jgi:ABC-2 type transport system permease protein